MLRTKASTADLLLKKPGNDISRRSFLSGLTLAGAAPLVLGGNGFLSPAKAHYQAAEGTCSWPTSTSISPSGTSNQVVTLPYSDGSYIQAAIVFNVDSTGIALEDVFDGGQILMNNDTIVTNLGTSYAQINTPDYAAEGIGKSIAPREATVIRDEASVMKASAAETPSSGSTSGPVHLAFIRTASPRNLANALANSDMWQSYTSAGCWPEDIGPYPLWMSKRAEMTSLNLSFDPWEAANQATPSGKGAVNFDINSNLWWLPAMSDAAVHHCHYKDFIEVHTQLLGAGRMQKFDDIETRDLQCTGDEIYPLGTHSPPPAAGYYGVPGTHQLDRAFGQGMYEEYRLAPADTNVPFPYVDDDMNFIYPWHQYYADTDCLWVVWELIPSA